MRAEDVKTPIYKSRNHRVLFESPVSWDEEWSIVEAEYDHDGDDTYERCLGIRWDGERRDPDSKGFPLSSGKAVWFWLPKNLEPFFYAFIIPQLTERANAEKNYRSIKKQLSSILEGLADVKKQTAPAQPQQQRFQGLADRTPTKTVVVEVKKKRQLAHVPE